MINLLKHLSHLCLILICITTTISCKKNEEISDINKVWQTFYDKTIPQLDKVKLLSSDYKKLYSEYVEHAFTLKESDLRKMKFEEKLQILMKRNVIDSLSLNQDELDSFAKAFSKIETTSTELINIENGLDEIVFIDNNKAYGVFKILFSTKSNEFVKENNQWKINPFNEFEVFDESRIKLKSRLIDRYGSEDLAVDKLLLATTKKSGNWNPLIQ